MQGCTASATDHAPVDVLLGHLLSSLEAFKLRSASGQSIPVASGTYTDSLPQICSLSTYSPTNVLSREQSWDSLCSVAPCHVASSARDAILRGAAPAAFPPCALSQHDAAWSQAVYALHAHAQKPPLAAADQRVDGIPWLSQWNPPNPLHSLVAQPLLLEEIAQSSASLGLLSPALRFPGPAPHAPPAAPPPLPPRRPPPEPTEAFVGPLAVCEPYCTQVISEELNSAALQVLWQLRTQQARVSPDAQRLSGKHYFCSLKEVSKVLPRAQALLVAPDVRRSATANVRPVRLLAALLEEAERLGIPVVFCLSRRGIGQVFGRDKSMSVVAVMHTEICVEVFQSLLRLAALGRRQFRGLGLVRRQSQAKPARG